MKKNVLALFGLIFYVNVFGQIYDARWVIGPNTSILDFNADTILLDTIAQGSMETIRTNANICDSNGNLLYFTNGYYIATSNGAHLLNGDTLSPCLYTDVSYWQGEPLPQAAIFLPRPDNYRNCYLFHFAEDTLNRPNTIYYSLIDKEGNGGLGVVVRKNIPILKLTGTNILRGGGMTACKHANGRDYWVIMLGSDNNEFYKFLLTPDTILGPFTQYIGPAFNTAYDLAYSKFSDDGSKYVTSCIEGLVLVMDFDRCTGMFSNPVTIFHNASTIPGHPVSGAISVEFSPNGRFVYATNSEDLTQYDLLSANIQDSVELYVSDSTDRYGLDMLQRAGNGKLYCSTYDGGLYALHVINYPDSLGVSCDFVYGGQPTMSVNSYNVPNMINYNLGALIGSGCDTITSVQTLQNASTLLRVLPIPADKYLYVEMGVQGNYEFDLLNENGQVIDRKETRQVDDFDTERLASGVYFLKAIDKGTGKEVEVKKVVVQH